MYLLALSKYTLVFDLNNWISHLIDYSGLHPAEPINVCFSASGFADNAGVVRGWFAEDSLKMGNCNIAMGSPPLADGEWRTSTRNVVTTTEGATEKIRFGIHRIAKTMKPGKHQDRFSFLMREEKTTNIDGDVVTSRSHRSGGAFAVGVYDGHGESPNAAGR